ncbi:uncharacterized protein LOC109704270 [Ananas comosus]|uniref:Uncharacterized protein LOC109704270 n=1 Tax=Ananas comosus TaxID=4615 RepID=A0A199VQT9_ANACO|nr:uncharacterized protein LOC109704270 [Ananas comosus]XP_020080620.1 uncharacterized protein LOC109704270 [Ananas comosus]XP_020080621.1 uncharacterized protein LOC109704270 [Ananas comosus]OAY79060.1 hypothetical protein ACMD2_04487 [Ananas comosus]
MHKQKAHHRETHGTSDDIDEDTPVNKVKGPNVFERAKEEIEALLETIQSKDEANRDSSEKKDAGKEVKEPNSGEKAKEESEGSMLKGKAHTTETHGTSSDVDENTPIDKIKGPNVFERAMEEIEAIVEAIHPRRKD